MLASARTGVVPLSPPGLRSGAPPQPTLSSSRQRQGQRKSGAHFWGYGFAGQIPLVAGLQSGAVLAVRRRHRPRRSARTTSYGVVDARGRYWETTISKVGPPVPEPLPTDVLSRWQAGVGRPRMVCHATEAISALTWQEETLCFGTVGGLVRSVDVQSGAVVGDYYTSSHLPGARITAMLFDGTAIVVGDTLGRVHAWRAELPGSWGFASSPDWEMTQAGGMGKAHDCPVRALVAVGSGSVVSADAAGKLAFWEPFRAEAAEVKCLRTVSLPSPPKALCVAGGKGTEIYAGLEDGSIFSADAGAPQRARPMPVAPAGPPIGALAWEAGSETLLVGRADGSIEVRDVGHGEEPYTFKQFHTKGVRSLSVVGSEDVPYLLSTGEEGAVGVWDLCSRELLWGLHGLFAEHLLALGDRTRLVSTGVVVNPADFDGSLPGSWKERNPAALKSMGCEGILCFDFLDIP